MKSLKKNFAYNLFRTFLSLVFPIITFAYASRVLGKEGIGKVSFASSVVSYFVLFASLGIANYGIREGARIREEKDKLSKLVQELFFINVITTLATYFFFFLMIKFWKDMFAYKSVLLISSLTIGLSALGMDWLYTAMEDYKYITIRQTAFQVISLILLVLCVKNTDDYKIYAGLVVLSGSGANILNFIYIRKYVSFKKYSDYHVLKHIKSVSILFFYSLSITLYNNIDTVMLGLLVGDASVGSYSASVKINRMVITLLACLGNVLVPRLSYYLEKEDKDKFYELLQKSLNFILIFSIPAMIGLWQLGKEIIIVFSGKDFLSSVTTMKILLPIVCIIPLTTFVNSQILIPTKKEVLVMITTLVGCVSNVILNALLIPKYAENGAAFASVIAELLVMLTAIAFVWNQYKIKDMINELWKYIAASFIIIVVSVIAHKIINNTILLILIIIPISIASYFGCLILLKSRYALLGVTDIRKKLHRD